MAKILATSRKGGTGKSSIAVNLAACWAATGDRVLLVDLDPQADSSTWLGMEDSGAALADALCGRVGLESAIRTSESGVHVAPAGEAVGCISESIDPDAVGRALESVRHLRYDSIVIDCPPELSRMVFAAWRVSGALALVPVDGPKAFRAVARLCAAWRDAGLDDTRMRVVLTRHDRRRLLDRELARQARERYAGAVLECVIRESVVMGESAAWRAPLTQHAPEHPITDDLRRLALEVAHG